ncbi:MAG TPA: BON domain-containing protein [Anaerolineae bacterium]
MDYDIQTDAERIIREDEVLCGMTDQVDVLVSAGIVYLSGYVATIAHKARAESDVSRVEGVEGVENHLYSDEELRVLVADEISRDADLSRHLLEVRSTKGFIRLDGHVASDNLAKTAVRLAGGIRGVRAVVNCLRWPGAAADRAHERVLLPCLGQDVYASDRRLGRVERVIVDASNHRVTAIAVDAHFGIWPQDVERRIRVPIGAVRCVKTSGVELNMTAGEAINCTDLEPQAFVTPGPTTLHPYGYLYSEVLLEPGGTNCQARRGQS